MVITHQATGVKQPHQSNKIELSRLRPQGASTVRTGTYMGVSLTYGYFGSRYWGPSMLGNYHMYFFNAISDTAAFETSLTGKDTFSTGHDDLPPKLYIGAANCCRRLPSPNSNFQSSGDRPEALNGQAA